MCCARLLSQLANIWRVLCLQHCYFKMCSLDHIYGSTWQKKELRQSMQLTFPQLLSSGGVPVLKVLFSTEKTIFCRERSSRHSLGQAEPSEKDDISHCQQVPWYLHLSRVIKHPLPSPMNHRKLFFVPLPQKLLGLFA